MGSEGGVPSGLARDGAGATAFRVVTNSLSSALSPLRGREMERSAEYPEGPTGGDANENLTPQGSGGASVQGRVTLELFPTATACVPTPPGRPLPPPSPALCPSLPASPASPVQWVGLGGSRGPHSYSWREAALPSSSSSAVKGFSPGPDMIRLPAAALRHAGSHGPGRWPGSETRLPPRDGSVGLWSEGPPESRHCVLPKWKPVLL